MKKRFLTLIFGITSWASTTSIDSFEEPMLSLFSPPATEQNIIISPGTRAILHLFYTTQRLAPITHFINQMATQSRQKEEACIQRLILFFAETNILKSCKMQTVFSHIRQGNSLAPFYQVWERLKHFRYGVSPSEKIILLDFAKLCLVAYQAILSYNSTHKNSSNMLSLTPEDVELLEIEQVFERLENYSVLYSLRYSSLALLAVQKIARSETPSSDFCASFSLRYYLLKRLQATFKLFQSLQARSTPIFLYGLEHLGFKKEDLIFNDPIITAYFSLLLEEKHLRSLMQLIEQFQSFDFIKHPTFTKEFLLLLCLVYKDVFTLRSTETFNELQELSLEQILNLIDIVNEKYNAHTSSPTQYRFQPSASLVTIRESKRGSINALIELEYNVTPDIFINMVFHRYYYIKRLEEVTKILIKLTCHEHGTKDGRTSLFLKPLALVWEDFKTYHEIYDQKIIEDFAKEIFIISHTVLHTPVNQHHPTILQTLFSSQHALALRLCKNLSREQDGLFNDFRPWIEIDKVINRFYLLRRLDPIFQKLHLLNSQGLLHLGCHHSSYNEIDPCLEQLHITKEPILNLIRSFYETRSFRSLFTFWNNLNRYKYIQDEEIIREFARLITHLLHRTAVHASHRQLSLPISKLDRLPYQLQQMPLEDILNLLDILADELPEFLEKHEIRPGMDWKEWLKKYWLLFPISFSIFAFKIYLMSHTNTEYNHPSVAISPPPVTNTKTP